MVEDWESEFIILFLDSNIFFVFICLVIIEVKNFFKEIMKSVKKDVMKFRLLVLKYLIIQEEFLFDGFFKID